MKNINSFFIHILFLKRGHLGSHKITRKNIWADTTHSRAKNKNEHIPS